MLNFYENYVKIKKKEPSRKKAKKNRFCGKKQNKVYFIEIGTIQNVIIYVRINFLSHSHQKKHLLQNPSPTNNAYTTRIL